IGRTARLGAEGDAISFACERYAMSLPDIEAFIEQKIPVAPVQADLLVSRPRAPRAALAEGEVAEEESIGTIFREARAQKAADEERRGGGRSSGPGGRPGRSDGARRSGSPGAARPPRSSQSAHASAEVAPATVTAPEVAPTIASVGQHAVGEGAADSAKPRKRRRRRNGRPVEGGAEGTKATATGTGRAPSASPSAPARGKNPPAKPAAPKPDAGATPSVQPGLLGRIGRGLKSLVTRAPRSNH
ncbi:MAG: ATP-dependent RNA helicase RhlB, partial [Pseudomonadota bacterium]|nr:ATP-dependent RNA helicase RhlB [Pseudomonadota bacterium]